ncbi:MAG TPA: DUF3604 domain-containing protein, partial [Armatimonadota bacterium]|nr:DUF3604 domain-containing protein [Armatimonadota bacterium]
ASLHIAGHISISDRPHLADGRATVTAEMGEGIGWLTALDTATGIAGAGDPIGAGFLIDGDRIFFGDIHGQVRDSIGTGTHEEYLGWARDVERLDFCSPANHYGGREHADERTWARCVDATNAFNAPGEFATLVAYECAPSDGHRNVYCRGDSGRLFLHGGLTDPGARVMPELVDRLTEAGSDVFIVPHHPNFCSPVDWTKWGGRYQRLVEIASQWGVSEEGPVHSVRHALNMGHRLGIIAGSDTHMGTPGRAHQDWGQPCGLAAVIAPELTREAIWDALHGRRCYGVFGERMLIDFRLDGQMMGSETRGSGPRTMATRVATRTPIASLEIIRNGEVARAFDDATGDRLAEMKWTDDASLESLLLKPSFDEIAPFCYYYLRVKTVTGNMGWSSPIWVT